MFTKNPLRSLLAISRSVFLPGNKKKDKAGPHLSIEKKWWMGEDLFIDQKPFMTNILKNKRFTS